MCVYIYRRVNLPKNDKRHFLFFLSYSPHIALDPKHDLSKKAGYCPLSSIACSHFTAERKHLLFWTEADKSILANQHAVFRSGDKATFTWWTCDSSSGLKGNKSWNVFTEPCKSSVLQWWGKAPCIAVITTIQYMIKTTQPLSGIYIVIWGDYKD